MNEPPSPNSLKPKTPPPKPPTNSPYFVYEKGEEEPKLEDTHPRLANLLHVFVVTTGLILAFLIGGFLIFFKSGGIALKGSGLLFFILGGILGVRLLIRSCSND